MPAEPVDHNCAQLDPAVVCKDEKCKCRLYKKVDTDKNCRLVEGPTTRPGGPNTRLKECDIEDIDIGNIEMLFSQVKKFSFAKSNFRYTRETFHALVKTGSSLKTRTAQRKYRTKPSISLLTQWIIRFPFNDFCIYKTH